MLIFLDDISHRMSFRLKDLSLHRSDMVDLCLEPNKLASHDTLVRNVFVC